MKRDTMEQAVKDIVEGQVVVFPTETVYGLGANALNDLSVAKVFSLKKRPSFNPLIVHVASLEEAQKHAFFDARSLQVAQQFWPGPLTLVLPRRFDSKVSLLVSSGLDTLAIRVPQHPMALEFLKKAGVPVAAPSANISGGLSPTDLSHVRADFGDRLTMLDGGSCPVGLESTIVDLSDSTPVLLRPGGVAMEDLAKILGPMARRSPQLKPNAPGQLESHYAPKCSVRLLATHVRPKEALLAFGKKELPGAAYTLNLSPKGDVVEAAANLFRMLHELDQPGIESIAVMEIPDKGLGLAINDRLKRAAATRF